MTEDNDTAVADLAPAVSLTLGGIAGVTLLALVGKLTTPEMAWWGVIAIPAFLIVVLVGMIALMVDIKRRQVRAVHGRFKVSVKVFGWRRSWSWDYRETLES